MLITASAQCPWTLTRPRCNNERCHARRRPRGIPVGPFHVCKTSAADSCGGHPRHGRSFRTPHCRARPRRSGRPCLSSASQRRASASDGKHFSPATAQEVLYRSDAALQPRSDACGLPHISRRQLALDDPGLRSSPHRASRWRRPSSRQPNCPTVSSRACRQRASPHSGCRCTARASPRSPQDTSLSCSLLCLRNLHTLHRFWSRISSLPSARAISAQLSARSRRSALERRRDRPAVEAIEHRAARGPATTMAASVACRRPSPAGCASGRQRRRGQSPQSWRTGPVGWRTARWEW